MKVESARSDGEADRTRPMWRPTLRRTPIISVALAAVLIPSLILRFVAPPNLWLDEALTANIASLPSGDLQTALVRDGSPPLYYFLLHSWTRVFGSGDGGVRSLSGVLGVLAIGVAFIAGRRYGRSLGERQWLGVTAAVVVATSPFAIRYSTEARMYSLTIILVAVGAILLHDAWSRPTPLRLVAMTILTAGLLYTHYWSFFLLMVVGAGIFVAAVRSDTAGRCSARRLALALGAGVLLFTPWIPTLLIQLRHTGTPWAVTPTPAFGAFRAFMSFGGTAGIEGWFLAALLMVLALLPVFKYLAHPDKTRHASILLATCGFGTLVLGVTISSLAESAFEDRYAAIAFPLIALSGAIGIVSIPNKFARTVILAVVATLGLWGGIRSAGEIRTASGPIVHALRPALTSGDLVVYCPDQLAPSTARLLPRGTRQVVFPDLAGPKFVDWTDYAKRNGAASPMRFAQELTRMAGKQRIWLVWSPGYKTLGTKCEGVINELMKTRHSVAIVAAHVPKHETIELRRFDR